MNGTPETVCDRHFGATSQAHHFLRRREHLPDLESKNRQQVAFVSDRGGIPQLYVIDADVQVRQKLTLPTRDMSSIRMGPPNGQLLAFSWRRPNGNTIST